MDAKLVMNVEIAEPSGNISLSESCARTAVTLMMNIVEMACEHEPNLELMRLVNYMDLYRTYLAHVVPDLEDTGQTFMAETAKTTITPQRRVTDCASFEQFVSDFQLLKFAAQAASRDTGMVVPTPAPLKVSANSDHLSAH